MKMNEYEKAFVEQISRSKTSGPEFARLTKEALEAEYGGEVDNLTSGLSQEVLEDPERFAAQMYKTYGNGAIQYFETIVKYVESGKFHPDEEAEEEAEEEDLESIVHETVTDSERETGVDSQA